MYPRQGTPLDIVRTAVRSATNPTASAPTKGKEESVRLGIGPNLMVTRPDVRSGKVGGFLKEGCYLFSGCGLCMGWAWRMVGWDGMGWEGRGGEIGNGYGVGDWLRV